MREIAQHLHSGQYIAIGGWQAALTSCAFLPPAPRRSMDWSDAAPGTPHGMKIYRPWAKDANAYSLASKEDQPLGQVVVKESWVPKEVAAVAVGEVAAGFYAVRDGRLFEPDEPKELFIMLKDDPAMPNTDAGWLYGVVTADGKEVISSGRIEACVDCHRQARHDRVFGQKPKTK